MTKVLLVGPLPPPHGGISVHVASARDLLARHGVSCAVIDPAHGWRSALAGIRRHAAESYMLHVHANGHNARSWLAAIACALAARRAPCRVLTLHSGMLPEYVASDSLARAIARTAAMCFDRFVCVSAAVRDAVLSLGVDASRILTMPAYLPVEQARTSVPPELRAFLDAHEPVLTATLAYRPEYGFELLLEALGRLARRHPNIGCIVMGGGTDEQAARAWVQELGLEDRFALVGDVPHELCLALIARSHLFVRPTLRDGDAISVREALALGRRVVASDAASRPEGVVQHRSGDARDLTAAVESVLSREAAVPASPLPRTDDALRALLATYAPADRTPRAISGAEPLVAEREQCCQGS